MEELTRKHLQNFLSGDRNTMDNARNIKRDDLYKLMSLPPNKFHGNYPRLEIYEKSEGPKDGFFEWESEYFIGEVLEGNDYDLISDNEKTTNTFKIAYTKWGNWSAGKKGGPILLFLHGVPAGRSQYYPLQALLSPFYRTISISLLGLEGSDKPLNFRRKGLEKKQARDKNGHYQAWIWSTDVEYIEALRKSMFPNEKFFFYADDWGAGPALFYAARYNEHLLALGLQNPIFLDGYPVPEIQTIGLAALLEAKAFMMAMANFNSVLTQILKTMVHNPDEKFNQWSMRHILRTYFDNDYDRNKNFGELNSSATSMTLRPKFRAIRSLCERSTILSSSLLLPKTTIDFGDTRGEENDYGVNYNRITVPVLINWGDKDNMMPTNQLWRASYLFNNTRVQVRKVPGAGHFSNIDKPKLIAENIIAFTMEKFGNTSIAQPFLGLTGIWKGDEERLKKGLERVLYSK